jgi:protein gp37
MTKIEWCDRTINPISGCMNDCDFCYARKMANRQSGIERKHPNKSGYPTTGDPFRPTFHPDKLQKIIDLNGSPKGIFLDSMSDWFSPAVEPDWLRRIIKAVTQKPEHTFMVLTKRPDCITKMLNGIDIPSNLWLGTSITDQSNVERIDCLKEHVQTHRFLSIEPLHGAIDADFADIEWIIVGAETGNRKGKILPKQEWVENIIIAAERQRTPVFLKNNLRPYYNSGGQYPQEFP